MTAPTRVRATHPGYQSDTPSCGSMSISGGDSCLSAWGCDTACHRADTDADVALQLDPDKPVIVGRAEGHHVPYLDPAYRATQVVPQSGQSVVHQRGLSRKDTWVSRGHFTLRAHPGGILFVNGVPGVDGGIRPPTNWTGVSRPAWRTMEPAEEYLIESGTSAEFSLPNGVVVRIAAA
jgi:hypothetical protein